MGVGWASGGGVKSEEDACGIDATKRRSGVGIESVHGGGGGG